MSGISRETGNRAISASCLVERRGFEPMAIGRCRSSDPKRWRNTAHSRQTLPSPSPFAPKPIRAADLAPSASTVRRSVSFALYGHEPFPRCSAHAGHTVHRRSKRWPVNVEWCCRRPKRPYTWLPTAKPVCFEAMTLPTAPARITSPMPTARCRSGPRSSSPASLGRARCKGF